MHPSATESRRLRNIFVDSPESLGERARHRRWEQFLRSFPHLDEMDVIDLGGTPEFWLRAPLRPRSVHVVNLERFGTDTPDWLLEVEGDACDLPAAVRAQKFDLAFSNSVIEHVGGHRQRILFADTVHRMAPRHWVQTPYRYFPVEPHWVCPGMQYLPVWAQARVGTVWPLAHTRPTDLDHAIGAVMGTELLSKTQMRFYFPDSLLVSDRFCGLVKSIIALRS